MRTRPVSALTAAELGVHRSLGDGLPAYVPRAHDERLAAVVAAARAGQSGIAMLVSGSSSGKTRACFEAVQGLVGWQVWPAVHPADPRQVLAELPSVGPHTVVWLNEAQRYLLDPADVGEEIAVGLRALLADESRGPVLVLGTLWPRYWQELTRNPEFGATDPVASRLLLDGKGIPVPDTFTAADLATASASGDSVLAEAVAQAEDAAVTQYLAGVPDLVQRYELGDQAQRAVTHAAMDARRMGHSEWLPEPFLRAASRAYLDNRTRRLLDRDPAWFDTALAELTSLGRAGTSILEPADGRCRLADYLEQLGRRTRTFDFPPQSFWDAVAAHVTNAADLARLGENAMSRFRLRIAVELFRRAGNNVATNRLHEIGAVLRMTDPPVSVPWVPEERAMAGPTPSRAFEPDTSRWAQHWRTQRVEDEAVASAADGHLLECVYLMLLREMNGDHHGAERLGLRVAGEGHPRVLSTLGDMRRRGGAPGDAERAARLAAEAGSPEGMALLASLTHDHDLARKAAIAGDVSGLATVAGHLLDRGDRDGARRLLVMGLNAANPRWVSYLEADSPWVVFAEWYGSPGVLAAGITADGSVETVSAADW